MRIKDAMVKGLLGALAGHSDPNGLLVLWGEGSINPLHLMGFYGVIKWRIYLGRLQC